MDVSVIYVSWNSAQEILESIDSIRQHARDIEYEIIVVDNASVEDQSALRQPGITFIRNTTNAGFGAGCNLGASVATGRYYLFLNPDTRVQDDILSELRDFMDQHPAAGACGSKIIEPDGSIHFGAGRSLLSLKNDFLEHSTLAFRFPSNRLFAAPYYSTWDHDSTRTVGTLLGACMMLRASVFKRIAGFDEKFFLYCEEVDLCKRVHDAGYDVYYVHTCRILHTSKHSTIVFFGGMEKMVLQYLVSEQYYFRKHYGQIYALLWRAMIFFVYTVRCGLSRKTQYLKYAKWALHHD